MKTTIKLSSLFPHARIMSTIIAVVPLISLIDYLLGLFFISTFEELATQILMILVAFAFTALFLIPITSYYKIIIDTEKQTIHYCASIFGIFKDRKPVPYTQFDEIKAFQKSRKKGVTSRVQGTYLYTDIDTDLLLYNSSKSKKLHIKNVGDGNEGIAIAKQISELTNIPLLSHEPKS